MKYKIRKAKLKLLVFINNLIVYLEHQKGKKLKYCCNYFLLN